MKNKIAALLLGAVLCFSLTGPAFAFAPPIEGETTSGTDQNGNTQLEIKNPGGGNNNPGGTDPSTPSNPGGSGDYDYTPSTPGASNLPVSTTGQNNSNATTTTTASPAASTQGGTASASVTKAVGEEIVKQAAANNSEAVVIEPKVTGDVTKVQVSIPASTVSQIGDQTSADLTISTPVANVTIPNAGLDSLSGAGGTVTITAEKTDNLVELSIAVGGKTVESIPGGVTLAIPMTDVTPGTVAVDAKTGKVIKLSAPTGDGLTVRLDGSANIVLEDRSKDFTDTPAHWASDSIDFVTAHGMFSGTSESSFSPDAPMTRAMVMTVLARFEGVDTSGGATWYEKGMEWSKAAGVSDGTNPGQSVTREQLVTMLYRYVGTPGVSGTLNGFPDAGQVSGYAEAAMRWAVETGLIQGSNGLLNPQGSATRAEVAAILSRFCTNLTA